MLRIGEAAKRFDISVRTLRYWEEMGVLKSTRAENGYRHYDHENELRIKQIVLLRKLKLPISDIERIFLAADAGVLLEALRAHLHSLRNDTAAYCSLIKVIEQLIFYVNDEQNLEQVFKSLEKRNLTDYSTHEISPQINLSERSNFMSVQPLTNVRIVKLPAMTVASYLALSAAPEDDCSKVFNEFVLKNSLHKRSGYRCFGFNNPSPSEGNLEYGYEMWVSIPDDFEVNKPLVKKEFEGGLYASVSTQMNEIGERWMQLHNWCVNSGEYEADSSKQWLEECSMDFEVFISEQVSFSDKQLDLLSPIKLI